MLYLCLIDYFVVVECRVYGVLCLLWMCCVCCVCCCVCRCVVFCVVMC